MGILLNAILPDKDYEFAENKPNDTGVDLQISQGSSLLFEIATKYGDNGKKEKE